MIYKAPARFRKSSMLMGSSPFKKPRSANAPGNLYVDESCIDCDVCRWMCPSVYSRKGVKSIVHHQPEDENSKLQAYAAMVSCPTGSIRLRNPDPLVKMASDLLPSEIDPENLPGIMHVGYHSPASYGATSYLVRRTGGNILIDTPRFNEKLAQQIELEGGISLIICTHKDDVADHDRWAARFPDCKRVMHRADVNKYTEKMEIQLEGEGKWEVADDVIIIHTPGHTAGSICVRIQSKKDAVLFTGDHLAFSNSKKGLDGFKRYNHGNAELQGQSIRMLADPEMSFNWIMPGHGRMVRFRSDEERVSSILKAADAFDEEDESIGMFGIGYS